MIDVPDFTPVVLITGFLGSGKTTLLRGLLADPALADTAVLINEFGAVGLDHHLVERVDDTTVLLGSGCVCCTVRGELAEALKDLQSRRARGAVPPFRRVVLETTGLADPLPALTTLTADPVLRHHFRAGPIVATADGVNVVGQLARQPESVRQIAAADRLVLTKADLCDDAGVRSAVAALRAVNPDAPLLVAGRDPVPAGLLLEDRPALDGLASVVPGLRCEAVPDAAASALHGGDLATLALAFTGRIDWTAFGLWLTMLLGRHGDRVLRVKGLLNVAGSDTPVAIHGVQHLVHVPTHLSAWPDADRRSRIVFITRGLDPALIERSLRAFRVVQGERA